MIGILLINLGTPDAPTEDAVRRYLNEFLSDPYVITLPMLLRHFLVQKIILPKRPTISAHAYQQVWTKEGSPLRVNSIALQNALQEKLGAHYCVTLGMRYGNPSIETALVDLQKQSCEKIIVLPLFPQHANATTQSAVDEVDRVMKKQNITIETNIIHDFYNQDFYIDALAQCIQEKQHPDAEFLLLSYHGLPKRHVDSRQYETQCYITADLLAKKLQLSKTKYGVGFQSRLGFTKWITPYTDQVIKELRSKGITRLSVVCPSFVADCIETLEEINIRLQAQWQQAGGQAFQLIPCLNDHAVWINGLSAFIKCH